MDSKSPIVELQSPIPLLIPALRAENWYAAQTRSRCEKVVANQLQMRGFTAFLPLALRYSHWTDRRKLVETPLFSSYVFVRLTPSSVARLCVLSCPGVVRFVGHNVGGTPIPDEQIESVRTLLTRRVPWASHPFLKTGQRVRIRGGALEGVEGFVVSREGEDTLVVSVDAIQRSLAIRIQGYSVEIL